MSRSAYKVVRQPQFILDVFDIYGLATFAQVIDKPDRVNLLGLLPVPCGVYERLSGFIVLPGLLVFFCGLVPKPRRPSGAAPL